MSHHHSRKVEYLKQQAAAFVSRRSEKKSLVTVTNVKMTSDGRLATIFISVYPNSGEKDVLFDLQKKYKELADHIKQNTSFGRIPKMSIEIDEGEKKRQKIEELSSRI